MYHIIINPASRSGKGIKLWKEVIEPALMRENVEYTPYFSKQAGDIAALTKSVVGNASSKPVNLIILGGDGTVDEALQGIDDFKNVLIGYIPTGSSNDLARDLGFPKDPLDALNTILHSGSVKPMDLGLLTYSDGSTRKFSVSAGIGFDAAICEEAMHSKMKNFLNKIGLGKLIYLACALKQLFGAKACTCELTIDDKKIDIKKVLFIANMIHRYEGGGFMFAPDATAEDGLLHLCTVGDISKGKVLIALPSATKGKHYKFSGITAYSGKCIRIKTSLPLWVHTDGEVMRRADDITLTVLPGELNFIR